MNSEKAIKCFAAPRKLTVFIYFSKIYSALFHAGHIQKRLCAMIHEDELM